MNEEKPYNKSLESIILTIIMCIYTIFSIQIMPILLFLLPIPFIIFGIKYDLITSLLSLITTFLVFGIISDPRLAMIYFLLFTPFIFLSIYLIKKRMSPNKVVFYSSLILFVSIFLIIGILNISGFDFVKEIEKGFSQALSSQLEILKDMGFTSYELLERRDSLKSDYDTFILIIPSTLLVLSILVSYISYLLTTIGLRKLGISILNLNRFSRFRLPDNFVLGATTMIVTVFVLTKLNIGYMDTIYVNIMVLLGLVVFVQGLSVINFLLIKIKMKKIMRVIIYLIIFFTPQFFSSISILGGIDIIFDIRKIKKSRFL